MENNLVEILCSRDKREIYCVKGSKEYKEKYEKSGGYESIFIESSLFYKLVSDWSFENLENLSREK